MMTNHARRAKVLRELLQGPAEHLRTYNMEAALQSGDQYLGAGSEIEALWIAIEALWEHHKSNVGPTPDHRGPAWQRPPYD